MIKEKINFAEFPCEDKILYSLRTSLSSNFIKISQLGFAPGFLR